MPKTNFAHIGGLIGGFLTSGIVARSGKPQWYFNRYLYLVLTIFITFSGIAYGFTSKQSKVIIKIIELEQLDNAQDWDKAEQKAEEILELNPGNSDTKALVLWTLAKAEALTQKYTEAASHAKILVQFDSQNGHYILGLIYYDAKQFDLSRVELLKAKEAGASYEQIDKILDELELIIN